MESAVVLLTGGVGSTVAAYRQAREGAIHPLYVDFGRPSASAERSAAESVAEALNARLEVLDLPHVRQIARIVRGDLPNGAKPRRVELGCPSDIHGLTTTLLSVGAEYAAAVGARLLVTGHSAEPADGSREMLSRERRVDPRELHHAFAAMLEAALPAVRPVKLDTPLIGLQPAEVIKLGVRFGAAFERTWSCHRTAPPCGTCYGCETRVAAFAQAGLVEPSPQLAGAQL